MLTVMSLMRSTSCIVFLCLLGVFGCGGGDPGEEGGLIGTGMIGSGVVGTISVNKTLASETVEIKARTGEKNTAALNRDRQYAAANLSGEAPFLVRSDLGNGEYLYAIAYNTGVISNVHSYSNAILRFWFQDQFQNIDNAFNNDQPLDSLPTQGQFDALSNSLFASVSLVLSEYGLTQDQILSANYKADDTGIDAYLDNNPVVVEGSQISIVITDPDTGFQSDSSAVLSSESVVDGAGSSDTTSPTVVSGVRAVASSTTEVVVVWDSSTDNVGVIGYQVERDGQVVATTPFPVFTDTNLQSSVFYEYTIVALDSSGNLSPASAPVIGRTLFVEDIEPPPEPTNVTEVESTTGRVELRWDISRIDDVVAFNVYRALSGETPELLLRSTSTRMTDTSVSGGIRYCYQIEAVDAAGNRSSRTDELCVTTQGSVVNQSGGSAGAIIGNLTLPNVDNISCDAVFPTAISEDAVFSEPCYLVNADVEILLFADVIIEAGTVLKFAQGTGLVVTTDASLAVNGLPESPIIFTGQEDSRGYWRGITYDQSESDDNQVVNAVIEYAGQGQVAAIQVRAFAGSRARMRIQNSLIRNNSWTGIWLGAGTMRLDAFDGNTITENRQPATISPVLLSSVSGSNDFTGNEFDQITVPRLPISNEELVIPDLDVPLKSFGLTLSNSNLIVDAGVEMIFDPNISIILGQQSNLIVNGSTDNPVLFTGDEKNPGAWGGVHLVDSPNSTIEGLTIEYGGQAVARFNANLSLTNSSVTLKDSTFRGSAGYGYFADEDSQVIELGNVQQIDNALQ